MAKKSELKTLKDLRIEEELCEKLDTEVYLPVKEELKGTGKTHSLGIKKENFKGLIEKKFKDLRQDLIKDIKFLEKLTAGSDKVAKELSVDDIEKFEKEGFCLFDAMGAFDNSNVIDYIKWKFNISEEDLEDVAEHNN